MAAQDPVDPSTPNALMQNEDLAPVPPERRTWGSWAYAAIWMGIAHNINQWILAASALALGLSFWQATATIVIAFVVCGVGTIINSYCATRYGLAFPVIMHAVFGRHAAKAPIFVRAIIAVFYFGVFIYVSGEAINVAVGAVWPYWHELGGISILGMGLNIAISFAVSLALHFLILTHGIERIRRFEQWAGPVIMLPAVGLLLWAAFLPGGASEIMSTPGSLSGSEFWGVFFLCTTGQIGSMATLMVNAPDLARFARNQRAFLTGTSIGLPLMFSLFCFVSLFSSAGSLIAFGEVITDPLQIIQRFDSAVVVSFGALCILASTLSLNAATNAVSVGFDFTGLFPRILTFKRSIQFGLIIGILSVPWLWYGKSEVMNNVFGVFGSLMGPLLAIMVIDYFVVSKRHIDLVALEAGSAPYAFRNGYNVQALIALAGGFLAAVCGLIIPGWSFLYSFNWYIGVIVGGLLYLVLSRPRQRAIRRAPIPYDRARVGHEA